MNKSAPVNSPYITRDEAADWARCSVDTIDRARRRGDLRFVGTAGLRRTTREWVDEWLKRRGSDNT